LFRYPVVPLFPFFRYPVFPLLLLELVVPVAGCQAQPGGRLPIQLLKKNETIRAQ
jgi:hypothetical protein